eukprot:250614-Chlamydomonas_euryale.AAC.1
MGPSRAPAGTMLRPQGPRDGEASGGHARHTAGTLRLPGPAVPRGIQKNPTNQCGTARRETNTSSPSKRYFPRICRPSRPTRVTPQLSATTAEYAGPQV